MNRTLIQAAGKCDIDLVMRTLAGEFGPVEEQDLNDAVIRAAGVGYADIVTCLLAKGADPDAEDPYGETPLIHAAAGNHIRAVRMILNAGSDVNWVNDSGRTALHLAVKNNCAATVMLILRCGEDCEVNIQDEEGESPLIIAADAGNGLMVQMLLQDKAKVNLQNRERSTALHLAVINGSSISVMLLTEADADVNMADIRGNTPLLLACQSGNDDIAVMLLEKNADFTLKDRDGKTALDYVMEKQMPGAGEFLFAAGAMDSEEVNNIAPIMRALLTGNRQFLRSLLGANFAINQKAPVKIGNEQLTCTALEAALRLGHLDMASLLLLGGCDFNHVAHWCEDVKKNAPAEVSSSENTVAWLNIIQRRPVGLRSLCRIAVRKQLGFCPSKHVRSLIKVRLMQQYLLFQRS